MIPFLQHIARYIHEHHEHETEHICIILPNKRGALYLKQHLANVFQKTIWLPTIMSAEEFAANTSQLQPADSIDLMCDLYVAYTSVLKDKAEAFDVFAKWGNLMLQDFNEADRYLVDTKALYQNLKEIKELENWSLSTEQLSETQEDYCLFMSQMGLIYEVFSQHLLQKKQAYQGLMYRKAVQNHQQSDDIQSFKHIIIAGFNALNKAETILFSDLVKEKKATIIWDADHYYVDNREYEAGLFLRKNLATPWLNTKHHIGNSFKEITKQINIVAVPKQIGQAQVVSGQLSQWIAEGKSLNRTAVVLADESLLFPILHQLPKEVEHVNITMEYPLRLTPIYDLIDHVINLHHTAQQQKASAFYFADVFKIIQNPLFKQYYTLCKPTIPLQTIIQQIIDKNYVWLTTKLLLDLFETNYESIQHFFNQWKNSNDGIRSIFQVLAMLNQANNNDLKWSPAEYEYLHVFTKYFNRLQSLIQTHHYLNTLSTLRSLYKQIIGSASVPFIGEPLQGLQIMGVLETRTLDFENIIVLGVNEGVLPSGKTANSFIPNDLKRYYGMPLYGDKDAIYAYHFYRLLQRASHVLITYNTEHSVLGSGEKSRFITQLQFELLKYNKQHQITETILSGGPLPPSGRSKIQISKTEQSLAPIIKKMTTHDEYGGLSPSALITHKECSLRFFFRYGAGMKETDNMEEQAESSTQGSMLHESLELLYKPYVGKVLQPEDVEHCLSKTENTVNTVFQNYFSQKESRFGKNYLQQKVLYEYVKKLLKSDLKTIDESKKTNEYISLIALEKSMTATLILSVNDKNMEVYIKGSADRIDRIGNKIRVIDYKSSVKDSDKFKFVGFEALFQDSQYNKMLQLFVYTWLTVKNHLAKPEELQPCIIPFKKFEERPKCIVGEDNQPLRFTTELLQEFETHLATELLNIISPSIYFGQTDDLTKCEYCPYADMCNVK